MVGTKSCRDITSNKQNRQNNVSPHTLQCKSGGGVVRLKPEHQIAAAMSAGSYRIPNRAAVTVETILSITSSIEEEGHLSVQNPCSISRERKLTTQKEASSSFVVINDFRFAM